MDNDEVKCRLFLLFLSSENQKTNERTKENLEQKEKFNYNIRIN